MISISTLTKLARGGLGPEEMQELFAAMGISMQPVTDARAEFDALAGAAILPSSKLLSIRGDLKSGETLHALLIVGQK